MVGLLLTHHIFAQIIVGPDNAFTFDYIFGVDINLVFKLTNHPNNKADSIL